MATCNSSSPTMVKQRPGCIAIGWSGEICKISDSTVVRHPKFFPGHAAYNKQYRDLITLGKRVYERLGDHKGIIKYLGIADTETGAISLAYAKYGDLSACIRHHDMPTQSFRDGWIRSLVDTFYHMYRCKVLHQDIKLNNIVEDNDCLKVIDFANSSLHSLDADMEAICAADPLSRVDILCLGCVIYSIATWHVFVYDYFEENRWPKIAELPPTKDISCGDIIRKCREDKYDTIVSLYEDCVAYFGPAVS